MDISALVRQISEWCISWPLIFFVMAVAVSCTIFLSFVQLRYFFTAWKATLFPPAQKMAGDMTPLQAFINTLSSNLGTGSIAGVAVAIHNGGPGSVFWIVFFGLLLMAVRFAEVYLSVYFGSRAPQGTVLGGPMLYLKEVLFGSQLSYAYAFLCFIFGLIGGCAIQANSISVSLSSTWGIAEWITSIVLTIFVAYVVFGGASRIARFSDAIVPLKVLIFFVSAFIILGYHYAQIIPALQLMVAAAFSSKALLGGALGFSIQQAIRYGMLRSVFATESGLGTAAIFFGFTGSKDPIHSGFLGMVSTFVSTLVCFIIALCIVASGVWHLPLSSTALTIESYNTVFGSFGGWIVSTLTITFGLGVIVAYAYVTRASWLAVTNGRYDAVYIITYILAALLGSIGSIDIVWTSSDIITAGMLIINLAGILYLLPTIRRGLVEFTQRS